MSKYSAAVVKHVEQLRTSTEEDALDDFQAVTNHIESLEEENEKYRTVNIQLQRELKRQLKDYYKLDDKLMLAQTTIKELDRSRLELKREFLRQKTELDELKAAKSAK